MRLHHHDFEYCVPDDWWSEAAMGQFVPATRSYTAGPSEWPALPVFEVAIDDVAPVRRNLSHGVFNDAGPDRDEGTARERVLRVLSWLRDDVPIEPVCVARLPPHSGHTFQLTAGAHRFYCALAVGFSHVPAVEVDNLFPHVVPDRIAT